MSKAAGILNRLAMDTNSPEKKRFLKLCFLVKTNQKLKITGPIIKSSALTVLPSNKGSVVKRPNIIVDIL